MHKNEKDSFSFGNYEISLCARAFCCEQQQQQNFSKCPTRPFHPTREPFCELLLIKETRRVCGHVCLWSRFYFTMESSRSNQAVLAEGVFGAVKKKLLQKYIHSANWVLVSLLVDHGLFIDILAVETAWVKSKMQIWWKVYVIFNTLGYQYKDKVERNVVQKTIWLNVCLKWHTILWLSKWTKVSFHKTVMNQEQSIHWKRRVPFITRWKWIWTNHSLSIWVKIFLKERTLYLRESPVLTVENFFFFFSIWSRIL